MVLWMRRRLILRDCSIGTWGVSADAMLALEREYNEEGFRNRRGSDDDPLLGMLRGGAGGRFDVCGVSLSAGSRVLSADH